MLTKLDEIKQELDTDWHLFADNQYPTDLLSEYADSACPIYTSEIIAEWVAMPSEFNDAWQDYGDSGDKGITDLMQVDLYNYYSHLYNTAYNQLADEKDAE